MKVYLNYNFDPKDVESSDFAYIYRKRRDSCFAFVFEKDGKIYALRDHFGIVPLYYIFDGNRYVFSTFLDLEKIGKSEIDIAGYKFYLLFGTTKVLPLFKTVGIVPPGCVLEFDQQHNIKLVYQYTFEPRKFYIWKSTNDFVTELDHLLVQAVKRTVKQKSVGLFFSGMGADSLLTAIYLTESGGKVNAYTCSRWGVEGSETKYSKTAAEIIGVENHYIDILDEWKVKDCLFRIPTVYKSPYGRSAAIGVTSMWYNTPLCKEKQVYGAQGADTINCAVPVQSLAFVLSLFPSFIRKWKSLPPGDVIDLYLALCSRNIEKSG